MKNWIIKLLGGYTRDEHIEIVVEYNELYSKFLQAIKNDTPRDPKTGRFVKK